ncbi:hypothetical protein C8R45DRAFT_1016476 [Mycena sanguinolenta]|nr:hypothetical protein C8R45DRAFT_1016476 [Mycena sanguinolenta]
MCQLDTSGIVYACGHYVVTSEDYKHDCGSRYCTKSDSHPRECRSPYCQFHYGPDKNQNATVSTEYCKPCKEGFFNRLPRR